MSVAELARQRMAAAAKSKTEGDRVVDGFLQNLMRLTFFAIEQEKEAEAVPIIEFLSGVVKDPEGLKTGCASVYSDLGRFVEAEMLLQQVLDEKPDYEPAQVCLAGVWVVLNKPGFLPLVERILSTSLVPEMRAAARMLADAYAIGKQSS
jgi:hypothetical protein